MAVLNLVSSRLGTGVSVNLWSCLKEVTPLVVFDIKRGMALEPVQGFGPHLELISGTTRFFTFLW